MCIIHRYVKDDAPVAFASWARFSEAAAQRYRSPPHQLMAGDWAIAEGSTARGRAQASGVIAAYAQWHLERGLRSLEHVDRSVPLAAAEPDRMGS
jgi:hypothetical protein